MSEPEQVRFPRPEYDEEHLIVVATGRLAVAKHPSVLMTPALGSCIGVAVFDAKKRRGGLAHVMLPASPGPLQGDAVERFATIAIPRLVAEVADGGSTSRLIAKIAGGSSMFGGGVPGEGIGERNAAEVRRQLGLLSVPILAEDVGGGHARTMVVYLNDARVVVRSYRYGIIEL